MSVIEDVMLERSSQQDRWGDEGDDRRNTPTAWVAYIASYGTRWLNGGFPPYDRATLEGFRASMIKVAALGVAAAEWADRLLDGTNKRDDVLA